MTRQTELLFIFLFSSAVISAAWAFELIGGYQPCALCLQQRTPYYAGIPAALALLVAPAYLQTPKARRIGFAVLSCIFAVSLFLSVQHAGVEWKWWQGPSGCGATSDLSQPIIPLGNPTADLDKIPVFCDEAALRVLGLSFAGWNAVASVILLAFSILGLMKNLKR